MRADLVFSYWVFTWYLLYAVKIINYSPKFALILGMLDNIVMFILMLTYGTSTGTIIKFLLINTLIKALPLYYVRNDPIKKTDIYFTFGVFAAFVIWIHLNNQSLTGNMKLIYDSLLHEKDQTPLMSLLKKIENNFKTMVVI
jgi:hypothetical protein